MMAVAVPTRHRSTSAQRFGYLVAAVVDLVLLYLVNVAPGWQALPFLTDDTQLVLGWVNASLLAGVLVNIEHLLHDAAWLRALGDLTTTVIGVVAMVRLWQVFPFAFDGRGFDWSQLVRVLLVIALVGSAINVVVQLVNLVRALVGPRRS